MGVKVSNILDQQIYCKVMYYVFVCIYECMYSLYERQGETKDYWVASQLYKRKL